VILPRRLLWQRSSSIQPYSDILNYMQNMTIVNNYIKDRTFSSHYVQFLFSAVMENWYWKIVLNNYEELLGIFRDSKHHWNFVILNHSDPKNIFMFYRKITNPLGLTHQIWRLSVDLKDRSIPQNVTVECRNDAASSVQALVPTIGIPPQTKPLDNCAVSNSQAVCWLPCHRCMAVLYCR